MSGRLLTTAPAAASLAGPAPSRRDPLAAVLALGDRAARVGMVIGIVVALGSHGAASARALMSLSDMRHAVGAMRASLHDFFWTNYDIEVEKEQKPENKPPPPAPEPAAPDPVPTVAPPRAEPKPKDPYDAPPPPAQAAKILTAPAKPDEPEDLTDKGIVSGDGNGPGYGQVSAAGTGTVPTFNPNAKVGGTPGGTGTGPVQAPPPPNEPDRSKPPGIVGGTDWNCPFPGEADTDQVDQAVATVVVTVRPDGTPLSVKVVSDPGHGFGRAARLCALGRRYTPGLDRSGSPTTSTTTPIRVRFLR